MNICETCNREFKTVQALGAHRVLYHRMSEADLRVMKDDEHLKNQRMAELEAETREKDSQIRVLEAERRAGACPQCEELVGWDALPIKECPLESYERGNPEKWCLILGETEMVKYRRCPRCGYSEKA
jgi:hypothetical protein